MDRDDRLRQNGTRLECRDRRGDLERRAPERLALVWETMPARGVERNVVGPANLLRWRERNSRALAAIAFAVWLALAGFLAASGASGAGMGCPG